MVSESGLTTHTHTLVCVCSLIAALENDQLGSSSTFDLHTSDWKVAPLTLCEELT